MREVHCDTMEGTWTGPRNSPRPSRGVSKWCESRSVAMSEWGHDIKAATDESLGVMPGGDPHTDPASWAEIIGPRPALMVVEPESLC